MKALLLKDIRLAMDMLLPWSLIVAGFVASMLVLVALPVDMRPDFADRFGIVEVLLFTMLVVGTTAFAAAAWATVCVVGGEERHGGRLLGMALPVAPMVRALSKHAAIAIAGLAPACVVLVAGALTTWTRDRDPFEWTATFGIAAVTAGVCAAAAWLALYVASFVRGAFSAVFITILCGGAAAMLGLLGTRLAIVWLARPYRGLDGAEEVVGIAWSEYAVPGGAVGVAAAALVGLAWGTVALVSPLGRTARVVFAPVALMAAMVAGAVPAHVGFARFLESRRPVLVAAATVRAMDDEELAGEVRRIRRNRASGTIPPGTALRDHTLLGEAQARASRLPADQWDRSPLVMEMREGLREVLTNPDRQHPSEWAQFVVRRDPISLQVMLEGLRVSPDDINMKLRTGYQASTVTGFAFDPADPSANSEAEMARAVDAALRVQLDSLLDGDFPDKDLVRAVLATLEDRRSE